MKTALLISGAITLSSTISAFTWVPDAWLWVKNDVSKDIVIELKEQREDILNSMASAKHWDRETDRTEKESTSIRTEMREEEVYIEQHLNKPVLDSNQLREKMRIEHRLDKLRKKLNENELLRLNANQEDATLLMQLSRRET